jgi:hypothetical protein
MREFDIVKGKMMTECENYYFRFYCFWGIHSEINCAVGNIKNFNFTNDAQRNWWKSNSVSGNGDFPGISSKGILR